MSGIILPGTSQAARNRSVIGYDNILERGTLTATSENPDFPVANVADWLTFDFFKPAATGTHYINLVMSGATAVDYFAFYGQSLYQTGGTIQLQYKSGVSWLDATPAFAPLDNAPRMYSFAQIDATEWRVKIVTGATIPAIAVIAFGKALVPEHGVYIGFSEPLLARANGRINSVSEEGTFLGSSVFMHGSKTSLVLQYANDAWVRASWLPFMKHMEAKPFFYAWDVEHYPNECAYCWVDGDLGVPSHSHYGFMGATTSIRAQVE